MNPKLNASERAMLRGVSNLTDLDPAQAEEIVTAIVAKHGDAIGRLTTVVACMAPRLPPEAIGVIVCTAISQEMRVRKESRIRRN